MAQSIISGVRISGIATSVPSRTFDNLKDTTTFPREEVRKVVAMAGVTERRLADEWTCSTDLCFDAAEALLARVGWARDSIDGLILVTQTPDYFMPSSSAVLHGRLGLSPGCAALDLGLGCSGYVYGLWMAAMMLKAGGLRRVLLLHGETPTKYASDNDRTVSLLFGDAGSATALERCADDGPAWYFTLHTDGSGYEDLIIPAGGFRDRFNQDARSHFVRMNGANVFNFTIKVIPPLIADTLRLAGRDAGDVDFWVFHQSNRFIINHLIASCGLALASVPLVLDKFGNSGGPSVTLAVTQALAGEVARRSLSVAMLGYGAGLSWAAVLLTLEAGIPVCHLDSASREPVSR